MKRAFSKNWVQDAMRGTATGMCAIAGGTRTAGQARAAAGGMRTGTGEMHATANGALAAADGPRQLTRTLDARKRSTLQTFLLSRRLVAALLVPPAGGRASVAAWVALVAMLILPALARGETDADATPAVGSLATGSTLARKPGRTARLSLAMLAGSPAAPPSSAAAPPSPAAPPSLPAAAPPYRFQPGVVCPLCQITPQYPHGRSGLHWHDHWGTVGAREYVTVGVLGAAALGLQFFVPRPRQARWDSTLPLDEPLRDALRIGSERGRERASTVSDVLFVWEVLHPSIIDPLLVAWWQRQSPFTAWQMLVIDAQAYTLTLAVNDLVKNLFARERPWVRNGDCEANPDSSACGSGGRNLSLYSGHAAVTATGAGLLCAHHTQLSLYQSDVLDTGTCALAVLGTALTGALRVASDKHWASDVLVGHLMGYASGYLMPTLLYYREFRATPHEHPEELEYTALPFIQEGSLGLQVLGWF